VASGEAAWMAEADRASDDNELAGIVKGRMAWAEHRRFRGNFVVDDVPGPVGSNAFTKLWRKSHPPPAPQFGTTFPASQQFCT
jgi:hypothetical protein